MVSYGKLWKVMEGYGNFPAGRTACAPASQQSIPHFPFSSGRPALALVLSALCCLLLAGVPALAGDDAAGQALAEKIRSSMPTEDSEIHGTLLIDSPKGHREIPVVCEVKLRAETWETIYQAAATSQSGAERLIILHGAHGPNQYLYARAATPAATLPEAGPVPPPAVSGAFAGSDYSLGDLGLEFLHWPGQSQLKGEMRLGQPCYVLESTNSPASFPADAVARIKSYIDKESGSLLIAEAYDARGGVIKKFSLHGSSFKKVNGRWRLEKMEIQNEKTDSQTVLKFDMPKD